MPSFKQTNQVGAWDFLLEANLQITLNKFSMSPVSRKCGIEA